MLSELETALDEEADVVVTLWRPFWANHAYPVKALEDPAGAFGEPESMHVMGRSGFGEDFAAAADHIGQISLSDEEYESLEKDRKSTRLNSSHVAISYAVFCLQKK